MMTFPKHENGISYHNPLSHKPTIKPILWSKPTDTIAQFGKQGADILRRAAVAELQRNIFNNNIIQNHYNLFPQINRSSSSQTYEPPQFPVSRKIHLRSVWARPNDSTSSAIHGYRDIWEHSPTTGSSHVWRQFRRSSTTALRPYPPKPRISAWRNGYLWLNARGKYTQSRFQKRKESCACTQQYQVLSSTWFRGLLQRHTHLFRHNHHQLHQSPYTVDGQTLLTWEMYQRIQLRCHIQRQLHIRTTVNGQLHHSTAVPQSEQLKERPYLMMMPDVEPIPSSAIPTNEELIAKIQCTNTSLPMIQMLITRRQATLTKLQLRKKKYPSHVVIPLRYMPCRQLLTKNTRLSSSAQHSYICWIRCCRSHHEVHDGRGHQGIHQYAYELGRYSRHRSFWVRLIGGYTRCIKASK